MLGLNEASNPAKEFGALSFRIVFCVGRRRCVKFRYVPLGPDQRAYRFRPPLGVDRLAAGQRFMRLVQQAPQGCPAIHLRLTFS